MHVSDCEEVKLTGRQSRLLEQFVLEMRHRTLQKGDGLVNAVRHALRPGRTLAVNQIYAEVKRRIRLSPIQEKRTYGQPNFQHSIRSVLSHLRKKGEVIRVKRGKYRRP